MVRKCSRGIAEITIMEVAHQVGVRTRARASMALAAASSGTAKKRKVNTTGELMKLSTTSFVITSTTENLVVPVKAESNIGRATTATTEKEEVVEELWCSSPSSDDVHDQVQASCCSSNSSSELADDDDHDRTKFIDLEANDESAEVETSTYYSCRERREMTLSSKLREELSDDVDSTMKPTVVDSSRRSVVGDQKMPTELELEEFFTVAEKDIQKRFQDKYNYDIVKDSPLEGRYEWVRLNP
ncbi:cyclin-dependent kinase inhibitor 7-like [Humulus lupulus]|uniref:cyclin-dependent kinase inhibitor 7-like n=1 Tax=Humulus lupulus TaxID=3486 RepID=UPI002B414A9D|nr:cyclin-dependent kinase inhibitor 7-like [Humulus lupulus]